MHFHPNDTCISNTETLGIKTLVHPSSPIKRQAFEPEPVTRDDFLKCKFISFLFPFQQLVKPIRDNFTKIILGNIMNVLECFFFLKSEAHGLPLYCLYLYYHDVQMPPT